MLFLLVIACDREPDAERYYRLTTDQTTPAAERIRGCRRLSSEAMQSDCQLTVARSAAEAEGLPVESYCGDITEPVWQSECRFMAAEHWRDIEPRRAAALCMEAEHFRNECVQHLWQAELLPLARQGSVAFPITLPTAQELFARWQPVAGQDSDMAVRFWRLFYTNAFQRSRPLQPSHCAPLPGEHQARCRESAAAHYTRKLRSIARIPRALSVFCALDPLNSAAAAATPVPELRAEPAAELDEVVVSVHGELCEGSLPRPDAADAVPLLPGFD